MSSPWKLFPAKLPTDFHGKPKPPRKLSELNRSLRSEAPNPEYVQTRVGHWQLRKLDADVNRERRDFIVHPAKISEDTPEWFKTTYHYFHRSNYNEINKGKVLSHGKAYSLPKPEPQAFRNTSCLSEGSRVWMQPKVTSKIGESGASKTGSRFYQMRQQVTGKVGSLQSRDYTIRRPVLKVGTSQLYNYINTYSVA